jgi:hypothetical protein
MPLSPVPTDPEPTDAEIEEQQSRMEFPKGVSDETVRDMSRFFWRARKRQEEPNSFRWPFSTDILELNYPVYLESDLWQSIRSKVLKKAGHECAACYNRATEVHHRDYRPRVLAGEDDSLLVPLCRGCHETIHKREGKRRDSWNEEERVLALMVARKENALGSLGSSIKIDDAR